MELFLVGLVSDQHLSEQISSLYSIEAVPKNPSLISITPVRDMIKEDWVRQYLTIL